MQEPEKAAQSSPVIEHLAMQMAKNKADIARWGFNLVIFLFAIVVVNIILTGQGAGIGVTAPLAVAGLAVTWLVGWRKGKRLFRQFYSEELLELLEKSRKDVPVLKLELSPRERQILGYVAQGFVNKEIAKELGISEQTVKNHVTSILRRLHAKDRTEAVVIAIKQGLFSVS